MRPRRTRARLRLDPERGPASPARFESRIFAPARPDGAEREASPLRARRGPAAGRADPRRCPPRRALADRARADPRKARADPVRRFGGRRRSRRGHPPRLPPDPPVSAPKPACPFGQPTRPPSPAQASPPCRRPPSAQAAPDTAAQRGAICHERERARRPREMIAAPPEVQGQSRAALSRSWRGGAGRKAWCCSRCGSMPRGGPKRSRSIPARAFARSTRRPSTPSRAGSSSPAARTESPSRRRWRCRSSSSWTGKRPGADSRILPVFPARRGIQGAWSSIPTAATARSQPRRALRRALLHRRRARRASTAGRSARRGRRSRENVRFYPSAAAAAEAGLPAVPALPARVGAGHARLARHRGARWRARCALIAEGALDDGERRGAGAPRSAWASATSGGCSSEHLGASPVAVAQTRPRPSSRSSCSTRPTCR